MNHFVWLTKFRYKGEDAFPLIDKFMKQKAEEFRKTCGGSSHEGPKAFGLYKKFGVFPIDDTYSLGDRAWGYWYHSDDETEKTWKEDPVAWYNGYFDHSLKTVTKIRKAAYDPSVKVTDIFPAKQSDEPTGPLIEALACDVKRVVIVNILNEGEFVPGVPKDFEVEVPALVNKRGIHGVRTGGLSEPVMDYLVRDRIAPVEMEFQAYDKGDKNLLLSLIKMDPRTKSEVQAKALLEDILALPWNEGMRVHYK